MQKSTPLSSLPNLNFAQQQTQQSLQQPQAMPPPQNTQAAANDVVNENPSAVQDALESLSTSLQPEQPPQAMDLPEEYANDLPSYNPDVSELLAEIQQQRNSLEVDMKSKLINDILSWNDDLKNALFASALFVFLYMVPIEAHIYKYVALDKIPHSNIIIKAAIMFLAVLVVSKLLKF